MTASWDLLQLWCATLRPYLSQQPRRDNGSECVEIIVNVGRFVGTAQDDYGQRLMQLQEALQVVVSALEAASATKWMSILQMCLSPGFYANCASGKGIRKVCFQLHFDVASRGDHVHTLRLVHKLLVAPSSNSTDVQEASSKIFGDTSAFSRRVVFSILLRPPAKDISTTRSSYIAAPSRAETLDYYSSLETLVKSLRKLSTWMKVHSLHLDLREFETPPDALASIGEIVAAGVPISSLAIQLAYTWDFFDHAKFVKLLNAPTATVIDHLQILATTRENYAASMESLPHLVNCVHVELEDRVLFGEMPPSFMSVFRRVFLNSNGWPDHWSNKKLTLRGLPFDEQSNRPTLHSEQQKGGLSKLVVYLASSDVAAFMQYLPVFGGNLEELEVHVTDRRHSVISLPQIALACPILQRLKIDGSIIDGLEEVTSKRMAKAAAWRSLKLTNVEFVDPASILHLARALQLPIAGTGRWLKELALVTVTALPQEAADEFERALVVNKRLQHLTLGRLENASECKLLRFHDERLQIHCQAFLSAMNRSGNANASASNQIDTWNLRHIMELADLCPRREVVLI